MLIVGQSSREVRVISCENPAPKPADGSELKEIKQPGEAFYCPYLTLTHLKLPFYNFY